MNLANFESISSLVNRIKGLLEGEFRQVSISGEISNLSHSSSGHYYFTLSDQGASISACLFKMDAMRNPVIRTLRDGDKVQVVGSLGVYNKRGTFQVIAKRITKQGKGDLKEQFELLKKKLASEGLFDMDIKKSIPKIPKRIAVITALQGAALADFLNILKRRSHFFDVLVVPTLVQGDTAPAAIRKSLFNTIKYSMNAEQDKKIDVIVLTRGGGSMEDLWCFNDEALAWDIYNCPIPTISAVGHQVDYTICDFVSDLRCETPSAAAQILSEEQSNILEKLERSKRHLDLIGSDIINSRKEIVLKAKPSNLYNQIYENFQTQKLRLERLSPAKRETELIGLHEHWFNLEDLVKRLESTLQRKTEKEASRLDKYVSMLDALNPNNVLDRGYSYVTTKSGKVLSKVSEFDKLSSGEDLEVKFSDGSGEVIKK